MLARWIRRAGSALLWCGLLLPAPARAVLDNRDRGPCLTAGNYSLRVTNAGIVGNAFFNVGLSNDPSFEYPIGSGHEALNYAALWVGALGGESLRDREAEAAASPGHERNLAVEAPARHGRSARAGEPASSRCVQSSAVPVHGGPSTCT